MGAFDANECSICLHAIVYLAASFAYINPYACNAIDYLEWQLFIQRGACFLYCVV